MKWQFVPVFVVFLSFGSLVQSAIQAFLAWHVLLAPIVVAPVSRHGPSIRREAMLDLLFVVIMLFGCVSSLAYVNGCERL
jgi:hypothetical protein